MGDASPEIKAAMQRLADSALQRLRNWEISEADLERLGRDGQMTRYLTLRAPAGGVVLEKPAIQGMRFMPGEAMFKIADLSSLSLLAEVFEQDLSLVRPGQAAAVTVNAYPGETFTGRVTFVYPTVNPQTRTAQVRIELPHPGGRLKPAMYASVELATGARGPVIAVPSSAVLHSGTRQVVLVELAEGQLSAAAGEAGPAVGRLRGSARGRGRGRAGGGVGEFPDRRREQSQGGARRLYRAGGGGLGRRTGRTADRACGEGALRCWRGSSTGRRATSS